MAETAASTAIGPMVIVSLEQYEPIDRRIVTDDVALGMLPVMMKLLVDLCNLPSLRRSFVNLVENAAPGVYTGMLCRKRYIQDYVYVLARQALEQVMVLGAGLDTLAYRSGELDACQVYEVDLPANIAYKQRKLESLFGSVPSHVKLVPVDFETQTLPGVLGSVRLETADPCVFVWEGVTQYLTETAVRNTLEYLSRAPAGSRLVFTYVLQAFISGTDNYESDRLHKRFRGKDPLWHFGLHPYEVAGFLAEYGWQMTEDVGAEDLAETYLAPIRREGHIAEIERIVTAEKV